MGSLEGVDGSQMRKSEGHTIQGSCGALGVSWPQGSQAWLVREQSREGTEGQDTLETHCEKTASWSPGESEGRGGLEKKQPLKKGSSTHYTDGEAEAHGAQSEPWSRGRNCQGPG